MEWTNTSYGGTRAVSLSIFSGAVAIRIASLAPVFKEDRPAVAMPPRFWHPHNAFDLRSVFGATMKYLIVSIAITLFVSCSQHERTPQLNVEQPWVTGVRTETSGGHTSVETTIRVPHSAWKTSEIASGCIEAKCGHICVSIPVSGHVLSEELFAREAGSQNEWLACSSRNAGDFWDCGVPWARFWNRRVIVAAGMQTRICYEFRGSSRDWDARLVVTLSQ